MVDSEAEITSEPWFENVTDTSTSLIVAILGSQGTGKSTLCNALFDTSFPVAQRTSLGTSTTRGILASRPESRPDIVVLDVEGADARERGRSGRDFQARCASFVTNLADCVVLNMWYHDTCRVDSSSYQLLRSVLHTCAQGIAQSAQDGSPVRSALVFAIRDVEDEIDTENLKAVVMEDVS